MFGDYLNSDILIDFVRKMKSIVKCNNCNIVIDENLAYIQNKISVIDEDTLTRICVTAFTTEEIKKSKSLLFESISDQKKITRKQKGKENRDIADIVSLLMVTDPDKVPLFVARNLEKLPPITFDHLDVTKLLKDLVLLQEEVKTIKSNYIAKDDIEFVRNGFLTQHISNDSVKNKQKGIDETFVLCADAMNNSEMTGEIEPRLPLVIAPQSSSPVQPVRTRQLSNIMQVYKPTVAKVLKGSQYDRSIDESYDKSEAQWSTVERRKAKSKSGFHGLIGASSDMNSKFKAADLVTVQR